MDRLAKPDGFAKPGVSAGKRDPVPDADALASDTLLHIANDVDLSDAALLDNWVGMRLQLARKRRDRELLKLSISHASSAVFLSVQGSVAERNARVDSDPDILEDRRKLASLDHECAVIVTLSEAYRQLLRFRSQSSVDQALGQYEPDGDG